MGTTSTRGLGVNALSELQSRQATPPLDSLFRQAPPAPEDVVNPISNLEKTSRPATHGPDNTENKDVDTLDNQGPNKRDKPTIRRGRPKNREPRPTVTKTFALDIDLAESLRTYAFDTRVSQVAILEEALPLLLDMDRQLVEEWKNFADEHALAPVAVLEVALKKYLGIS